ncbi:hypothetical protein HMI49_04110 [Corallococcus exercitus]|uniref:Uncharacterized protein n=1 Tax=Corallococcus exercitus TaxID=2316736 RepID=A0A7Y4KGD5_9BACT|nr:hypothetical protein [Corallococcus exercitus]NOK32384.1 hypothetical protein [Corallococcus exercitus]
MSEAQLLPTTPPEVLEQYPSATLDLTWIVSAEPAYRAVQVRPPRSVSPALVIEELEAVCDDLPRLLGRALDDPELRQHLLTPPPTRAQRLRKRWRRQMSGVRELAGRHWKNALIGALSAGLLVAVGVRPDSPSQEPVHGFVGADDFVLTTGVADAVMAEIEVTPPVPVFELKGVPLLALDMPRKPFKGQKRTPCTKDQDEILGACWVAVKKAPPCGENFFEHGDTCYAPIMVRSDGTEAPRSISQ